MGQTDQIDAQYHASLGLAEQIIFCLVEYASGVLGSNSLIISKEVELKESYYRFFEVYLDLVF